MKEPIALYDTTLRDGSQGEGVAFSTVDKLRILEGLDHFGVTYVEGGWPGSNPRDVEFFLQARKLTLTHARLAAFGSTRRGGVPVAEDENLRQLLAAETPVVTIFGKSSLFQVREVLRVAADENLAMIAETCAFLAAHQREVIYDAEHFFDGYRDQPEYALSTVLRAAASGATTIVLCDTNGGTLPSDVQAITAAVRRALPAGVVLGFHGHNDSGCGVANALVAVAAGARHVQGTINGIGERCGNTDLCAVIPALELKLGYAALPAGQLAHLRDTSILVYEVGNLRPNDRQPYVGRSAFAHKAGMHVNAVLKAQAAYEHVRPEAVGNRRRVLISDLAGGSNVMMKAAEHHLGLDRKGPEVAKILKEVKRLEHEGYEFEAADASFQLLIKRVLKKHEPFFRLEGFRVIVEKRGHDEPCLSEATLKVTVNGQTSLSAAEGDGPVNALDTALRKALLPFYPEIARIGLRDFKVRILDAEAGTAAKTRVLIESSDGQRFWGTVGVSENIIEASWQALLDSVEYVLYEQGRNGNGS